MTSEPRVAVRAVLKVLILLSKGPPNSGALVGCSAIVFGAPTAKSVGKDWGLWKFLVTSCHHLLNVKSRPQCFSRQRPTLTCSGPKQYISVEIWSQSQAGYRVFGLIGWALHLWQTEQECCSLLAASQPQRIQSFVLSSAKRPSAPGCFTLNSTCLINSFATTSQVKDYRGNHPPDFDSAIDNHPPVSAEVIHHIVGPRSSSSLIKGPDSHLFSHLHSISSGKLSH